MFYILCLLYYPTVPGPHTVPFLPGPILIRVKQESETADLKLNIRKTKAKELMLLNCGAEEDS